MAGLAAPLLARDLSTLGRPVEKATVRWSRVLVSVVPEWPMGKAMSSTRRHYLLGAAIRGEHFSVFFSILMPQPRFLQNPTFTMMRVHCFLSKDAGSGEGESGTPLA